MRWIDRNSPEATDRAGSIERVCVSARELRSRSSLINASTVVEAAVTVADSQDIGCRGTVYIIDAIEVEVVGSDSAPSPLITGQIVRPEQDRSEADLDFLHLVEPTPALDSPSTTLAGSTLLDLSFPGQLVLAYLELRRALHLFAPPVAGRMALSRAA